MCTPAHTPAHIHAWVYRYITHDIHTVTAFLQYCTISPKPEGSSLRGSILLGFGANIVMCHRCRFYPILAYSKVASAASAEVPERPQAEGSVDLVVASWGDAMLSKCLTLEKNMILSQRLCSECVYTYYLLLDYIIHILPYCWFILAMDQPRNRLVIAAKPSKPQRWTLGDTIQSADRCRRWCRRRWAMSARFWKSRTPLNFWTAVIQQEKAPFS